MFGMNIQVLKQNMYIFALYFIAVCWTHILMTIVFFLRLNVKVFAGKIKTYMYQVST